MGLIYIHPVVIIIFGVLMFWAGYKTGEQNQKVDQEEEKMMDEEKSQKFQK